VKKWLLWVEWTLLYVIAPIVIARTVRSAPWILALGLVAVGAAIWLNRSGKFEASRFWRSEDVGAEQRQLKQVLLRFSICAIGLVALTTAFFPEKLFAFPRAMPLQWALLLATYPPLSVYPQELLYRAFFLKRYQDLFPTGQGLWLANALAFAWLHLIFRNPLAVALTLVGGWFFAQTYAKTRSMRLVCLEHTLYGSLIFSVGLGEFFLQSALPR
jgi:membrane protease YdiL (CAAX protease family)